MDESKPALLKSNMDGNSFIHLGYFAPVTLKITFKILLYCYILCGWHWSMCHFSFSFGISSAFYIYKTHSSVKKSNVAKT